MMQILAFVTLVSGGMFYKHCKTDFSCTCGIINGTALTNQTLLHSGKEEKKKWCYNLCKTSKCNAFQVAYMGNEPMCTYGEAPGHAVSNGTETKTTDNDVVCFFRTVKLLKIEQPRRSRRDVSPEGIIENATNTCLQKNDLDVSANLNSRDKNERIGWLTTPQRNSLKECLEIGGWPVRAANRRKRAFNANRGKMDGSSLAQSGSTTATPLQPIDTETQLKKASNETTPSSRVNASNANPEEKAFDATWGEGEKDGSTLAQSVNATTPPLQPIDTETLLEKASDETTPSSRVNASNANPEKKAFDATWGEGEKDGSTLAQSVNATVNDEEVSAAMGHGPMIVAIAGACIVLLSVACFLMATRLLQNCDNEPDDASTASRSDITEVEASVDNSRCSSQCQSETCRSHGSKFDSLTSFFASLEPAV